MKLSKNTLAILKNCSSINSNLMLKAGNTLASISPSKWVYAEYQIEESFPQDFGIYDLHEFISVMSIFDSPELEFDGNVMYISEGKNRVRYGSADAGVLIVPKSSPKFPANPDVCFELSRDNLAQITRAASILKVPFVSIVGDSNTISIVVQDKNNPNSNQFQIEVGETEFTFSVNLKVELMKMMSESYEVCLSAEKRACKLVGEDKLYLLAWETDSTFSK